MKKLFVVVGHYGEQLIVIKATSKTTFYKTEKETMYGCVFYRGGEVACFPVDTAVQPENLFPISYSRLQEFHESGSLNVWESALPSDFEQRLRTSVRNHASMSLTQQRRVLLTLDGNAEAATRR